MIGKWFWRAYQILSNVREKQDGGKSSCRSWNFINFDTGIPQFGDNCSRQLPSLLSSPFNSSSSFLYLREQNRMAKSFSKWFLLLCSYDCLHTRYAKVELWKCPLQWALPILKTSLVTVLKLKLRWCLGISRNKERIELEREHLRDNSSGTSRNVLGCYLLVYLATWP